MAQAKNQNMFWGLFVGGAVLFILVLALFGPEAEEAGPNGGHNGPTVTIETQVEVGDWVLGNPEAGVVLVEYADYQCPACAGYHSVVQDVVAEYGDRIAYVYRHYPLTQIHPYAVPAARAAEAAGLQGKFFEMSDLLYVNQGDWSNASSPEEVFTSYAVEIGLDMEQYEADVASSEVADAVTADAREAGSFGLTGTPSFILDNRRIASVPASVEGFGTLIEQRLKLAELLGDDE